MSPKQKNKKKRFPKIMSYLTIILSLLVISFSLKYELTDFFSYENVENNESLVSLYAKNEYQKTNNFTSKIAIKNGCGKKRLGLIYKRYLLDLGYDVTETANATHLDGNNNFGHSATKILFHKKNKESAIYLSTELGIDQKQIFEDDNEKYFHDLTLILGQNYINLKSHKIAEKFNPFNDNK